MKSASWLDVVSMVYWEDCEERYGVVYVRYLQRDAFIARVLRNKHVVRQWGITKWELSSSAHPCNLISVHTMRKEHWCLIARCQLQCAQDNWMHLRFRKRAEWRWVHAERREARRRGRLSGFVWTGNRQWPWLKRVNCQILDAESLADMYTIPKQNRYSKRARDHIHSLRPNGFTSSGWKTAKMGTTQKQVTFSITGTVPGLK